MAEETSIVGSPVDAMYLIHKALRADAAQVEALARDLDAGESLQRFKLAFNSWATALVYHADQEDRYMTGPLTKSLASLDQEEAADSALTDEMKGTIVAQEEELHMELVRAIEDILMVLNDEIGKTSLITRTKQHLYGQIVALRIGQEDHLETEEALVLPIARERLTRRQQMEMARALLIDAEAEDPRWPIDWMAQHLDHSERKRIADLEASFLETLAAAD